MKNNDMRSMLKVMRELKKTKTSLITEQNISLDEPTFEAISELFPSGIIVDNIFVEENKKQANINGQILSLDIDFNMILKKSINESDCTIDLRKLTENSTVFSIEQDFIESLMEINDLYNSYRDVHKYVIDNNILSFEDEELTDDQD
jgi:hypothetical protein